VRIVGITLVRDEADIVATTIAYHLALGCDHVLVIDNGSTDGTVPVLRELAASTGRVSWSVDAGPYRQSELLTGLADAAAGTGADWVVPFDADEFWWAPRARLAEVLAGATGGALVAPVRNFVQRREQRSFRPEALLTMTRRVTVPVGPAARCAVLVASGTIGFVEMEYPPKLVLRPAGGVVIHEGSHAARGVAGSTDATRDLVCLRPATR